MYRINGQTVLEEEYDENYEPTEEGIFYGFLHLFHQIDIYCLVINGQCYVYALRKYEIDSMKQCMNYKVSNFETVQR